MTIVNTIENRILEMDGGEFQKLCDAYLSAIGYGEPNSTGSVAGSNKVRKGTPDTFFINRKNGKIVFAEYTTQKVNLLGKLGDDLGKCFDEDKTGVPINKIEEIIMCYTGQLKPSEVLLLNSNCLGIKLTLFSISALANGLISQPFLVRKFLDLPLDTGQVIPLEAFPSVYGKSKFATTLKTNFHFREKELEEFSNALETYNLIVVSGKPGVGKTRFALEGCRNFVAKNSEYHAHSIVSISQDLNDDLHERFSTPGQFLILVDDANRVIDFSYFMYLLRNQKDNLRIKIVVTVRDYALEKIENEIFNYPHQSMQLDRFTDEQIEEIAKDEFGIFNPQYLERIVDISGGNPRIAVMISKVAVEKNSLLSINDVSTLYDEYFSSIKEDLENFGDADFLKTAGIISFLRVVDNTNEQMISGIQKSFHISSDVFWNCAIQLHKLEMVDMYENEVVRISDQVLSTYLFYLAFFRDKILDFSDILQNYFPDFRAKIKDALIPALRAFNQDAIFDLIRPKVIKIWGDYEATNAEDHCLALAESFLYLLPAQSLTLIRKRLSQAQFASVDFSQLELDSNKRNNVSMTTELQILGQFRYISPDLTKIVFEILFDYLLSHPAGLLQVLHILVDFYNFDRYIARTGVSIQKNIVDMLWYRTENGKSELFSRLLIAVGEQYLRTRFESHEARNPGTVTFYQFDLPPNTEIFKLRAKIFHYLFKLYQHAPYQRVVFAFLSRYPNNYHISQKEIIKHDSTAILSFIKSGLSPINIEHNIFVNDYLDTLEKYKVTFDTSLRELFQNDAFFVYRLLSENRKDLLQYEYDEYQRIRKEHFISYFASFSDADIKHFIDLCLEIESGVKQNHDRYEIISGFGIGLSMLAETRQDLFETALCHYLQQGDKLDLHPEPLVRIYMMIYGKEKTFVFLNELDYPTKKRWLFGYYQMLSSDKIDANDLPALCKLFEDSEYSQLPNHLDFLLDYVPFDNRIVAKICQLILDKGDQKYSAWILNSITNPYLEINKHLINLFKDDIEMLKKIYLTVKAGKDNNDHNSATLSKILELDPEFIVEYIEWVYTPKGEASPWFHDRQDYSMLWSNQNYREIFKRIIDLVYKKEENAHWYTELRAFFKSDEEKRIDTNIRQRQEELLTELIIAHYQDVGFIEFLFEVIANFPKEQRSQFIFTFLQHNKNFADFQRLQLEPEEMSWSGSAVPVYQERIDYLSSLLPIFDNAQLLEHRIYVQQMIDSLEYQKNAEKKRDFVGREGF